MATSTFNQSIHFKNSRQRVLMFVLAPIVGFFATLLVAPAAMANPVYQVIDADNDPYSGIYLRNGTSMGSVDRIGSNYVIYGTNAELVCGAWGESVGPRANRRWHKVRLTNGSNAGRSGWVADRYMNTPNAANQPTPAEPECGGTQPASAPTSAGGARKVWVGSPVEGQWAWEGSSLPQNHALSYGGDWSVDLPSAAGRGVFLYAAPQDGQSRIDAKVEAIAPACKSHVIADGGYQVRVGLYHGSTKLGVATYAHLNPTVSVGQSLNRWGTQLGTVGSYKRDPYGCWDGTHVHVELYDQTWYSCFNKDYRLRSVVHVHDFIGFIGANVAGGKRQACA